MVRRDQSIDELFDLALHDGVEAVQRQTDAMVGATSLREVVGPDALAAFACSHLALACLGQLLRLRLLRHVEEPSPQDAHGLFPVLMLRLLVLARNDQPRGQVGDANGRVRRVHALPARTARPEHVDAQLVRIDLNFHLFGLGQNRHRRRRCMNAALGLGLRHPLHPVDAAFELQPAVGSFTVDHEDNLFESAQLGGGCAEEFDTPPLTLGVARVHAEKVGGENRGLVSAGSGPDLHNDVLFVGRILRQE